MSSLREAVTARFATLLTGTTDAGANVFRSRAQAISRAAAPAIIVKPGNERSAVHTVNADSNDFEVVLEIVTRGDPADQLADPIAVAAHQLVRADLIAGQRNGTAGTLGVLCDDIRRTQADWQYDDADDTAGVLTVRYSCRHLTDVDDITRLPNF